MNCIAIFERLSLLNSPSARYDSDWHLSDLRSRPPLSYFHANKGILTSSTTTYANARKAQYIAGSSPKSHFPPALGPFKSFLGIRYQVQGRSSLSVLVIERQVRLSVLGVG